MDRGAFWCATTDASRFDALLPPGPLVPELPTVLDLRQELPNSIDIALGPEMNGDAAGRDGLGRAVVVPTGLPDIGAGDSADQRHPLGML